MFLVIGIKFVLLAITASAQKERNLPQTNFIIEYVICLWRHLTTFHIRFIKLALDVQFSFTFCKLTLKQTHFRNRIGDNNAVYME